MSRISLQRWSIVSTRTLIKRWFVTPGDTVPINYIKGNGIFILYEIV